MNPFVWTADFLKKSINRHFAESEPWKVVSVTASSVLAGVWLWGFIFQSESITSRSKKFFFKNMRRLPMVSQRITNEKDKLARDFQEDIERRCADVPYIKSLKNQGMSRDDIIKLLEVYLGLGEYDWRNGFVSGSIYHHDEALISLLTDVYGKSSYTNPLHPDIFPGVCKMEAEVVQMAVELFHGGENACGTMTTGGTESIIMACKAYRDYAKEEKGIKYPEMVIPTTAHPAFEKGAKYLGITVKLVKVDPVSTCVSIKAMRKAITRNTIMLVGSVPNFPYGTMDDIQAIASLGLRYNIPVHADCCLGGFLAAFMNELGYDFPPFDFSVPGVTSISADTHKYGYTPKGSSVVLYSDKMFRHYQYCVTADWPGGIYGSPTVNGSRAGGNIAVCWATMLYFGHEGYLKATRKVIETARFIETELRKLPNIYIFGKPATSVIAFGSDDFHIYCLSEKLNAKGWNLNPLQFPSGVHLCVTHMHTMEGVAQRFVDDFKTELKEVMKNPSPKVEGKMAVYGVSHSIPDRSIVGDFARIFIDSMYYIPKNSSKSSHEKVLNGKKM